MKETEKNLALKVEETESEDKFNVYGRGILHLSILIETMRREGYELQVGKPRVIEKEINGEKNEPFELQFSSIAVHRMKLENSQEATKNQINYSIDKVFEQGFFLTQLKSDKSIIKNFKNINKGDQILISNSNETLEAEAIKVKKDKGE